MVKTGHKYRIFCLEKLVVALIGMEFHHDFIVADTFRTRKAQTALTLVCANYRAEPIGSLSSYPNINKKIIRRG